MTRTLDVVELVEVMRLVNRRSHPDKIDQYLLGRGFEAEELEAVYEAKGLTRRRLLGDHRRSVSIRLVGVGLILLALVVGLSSVFSTGVGVFSLGLLGYGSLLAITGEIYIIH